MLVQLTLSSHLREGLSDSSMLKDKSGSRYLLSGRTDRDRKYVWTGEARRRSRLFGRAVADESEFLCVLGG